MRSNIGHCVDGCGREVFQKVVEEKILQFEDYKFERPHTKNRCDLIKKYKPYFQRLENDLNRLRQDLKEINGVMFQ